jgi:nitrogen regulatory protein P-II 1
MEKGFKTLELIGDLDDKYIYEASRPWKKQHRFFHIQRSWKTAVAGIILLIMVGGTLRYQEDVKAALNAIGVNGITVSQVMGCGVQRGYKEIVRGMEVAVQMLPKIKFEIVVSSEEWEQKTIEAIQKAAFTGEVGDGKIFSYEIRSAQKIRTGETGYDALQSND